MPQYRLQLSVQLLITGNKIRYQISVFEIKVITSSVNSAVRAQNTRNDRMYGSLSVPPIKT